MKYEKKIIPSNESFLLVFEPTSFLILRYFSIKSIILSSPHFTQKGVYQKSRDSQNPTTITISLAIKINLNPLIAIQETFAQTSFVLEFHLVF
jgi:hypothetical protein